MFAALDRLVRPHATLGTMLGLLGFLVLFAPAFVILRMQLGTTVPPEAMFGYSAEQAYQILAAEGEAGRRVHLLFEIVDLLLIPVYTALYATAISYGAQRLPGRWHRVLAFCLFVPVLAGLIDYAEDGCLLTLLWAYPERLSTLATIAGVLTFAKWVLVYASLGLTFLALLGAVVQAWRDRRAYQQGIRLDLDDGHDDDHVRQGRDEDQVRPMKPRSRAV